MWSSRNGVKNSAALNRKKWPSKIYDAKGRLFTIVEVPNTPVKKNIGKGNANVSKSKFSDEDLRRIIATQSISPAEHSKLIETKEKKFYTYCRKFVKAQDKKRNDANWEKKSPAEKADVFMTKAASIYKRYYGLCKNDLENTSTKPIKQAIGPLRERGEKNFRTALEIVNGLPEEEKEKFWKLQERNRGVTEFTQLVTKRDYQEKMKLQENESINETSQKEEEVINETPQKEEEEGVNETPQEEEEGEGEVVNETPQRGEEEEEGEKTPQKEEDDKMIE